MAVLWKKKVIVNFILKINEQNEQKVQKKFTFLFAVDKK